MYALFAPYSMLYRIDQLRLLLIRGAQKSTQGCAVYVRLFLLLSHTHVRLCGHCKRRQQVSTVKSRATAALAANRFLYTMLWQEKRTHTVQATFEKSMHKRHDFHTHTGTQVHKYLNIYVEWEAELKQIVSIFSKSIHKNNSEKMVDFFNFFFRFTFASFVFSPFYSAFIYLQHIAI